jgi:hypothetical protein
MANGRRRSVSKEQQIRDIAYAIWESEGRPDGQAARHWTEAEERMSRMIGDHAEGGVGIVTTESKVSKKVVAMPKPGRTPRKTAQSS